MRAQTVRWKIARRHLNQRRRHPLRWIIPLLILLFLITGAAGAGTAAYLFASQLPPASAFRLHVNFQDARIYDSQGDLLFNMSNLSGQNGGRRIVEPLQGLSDQRDPCRSGVNRIPLVLQDATIATEDATFYKNLGFDPLSIVRAAYQDMQSGRIVSGASTITQQLVRDNMLTDRRSLNRKAEEVALAYEINKR
ncbi:MAG TPA: biosynthetic peptidoglycan transglycosylase, partial [Chloroflexota bacterium]